MAFVGSYFGPSGDLAIYVAWHPEVKPNKQVSCGGGMC